MDQLLLFFLYNFSSFFSYVGGMLKPTILQVYYYRYILAIQQIVTHDELPQKPWHHGQNNRKWLKQPQSHFY